MKPAGWEHKVTERIRNFFSPPVLSDDTLTRRAKLLSYVLNAHIAVALSFSLLYLLRTRENWPFAVIALATLPPVLGLRVLLLRGRVSLPSYLFLGFLALILPLTAFFLSRANSANTLTAFQSVIIVMAGLLIGGRGAFGFAAFNLLANGILLYAETRGVYTANSIPPDSGNGLVVQAVTFMTIAAMLTAANRSIRESFARASSELDEHRKTQDELKRAGATLRAVLESLPDVIFCISESGEFRDYIPAKGFTPLLPPEEFMGRLLGDVLPADVSRAALRAIQSALKNRRTETFEYQLSRDGKPGHFEARVVPMDEANVLAIIRDVSRRVQTDADREAMFKILARRNAYLRIASEVAKSYSRILDPDVLMKQAVNLIQEGYGLYYVGLFLVDDTGQHAVLKAGSGEAGKKMLAEGHALRLDEPSMVAWCIKNGQARIAQQAQLDEVRHVNPHLPLTRSEVALPLISRGQAIGALTVQDMDENAFTDEDIVALQAMSDQLVIALENARLFEAARNELGERQRAERELQQERDFAVQVMSALGQGVTVTDEDGNFEYVNPAYERMTGYTAAQLIGKNPAEFTHPDDRHLVVAGREHRREGKTTSYEVRLLRAGGDVVHVLLTVTPRYRDTEIIGSIAVVTDLTQQKLNQQEREALIEELAAKNAELERFTYTVSHDLKSPLITIRGFLGYLEQDALNRNMGRVEDDMKRIASAVDKMQRLLDDLLELSRVGRLMNPPEEVPFETIVRDALSLVEGRLNARRVKVEVGSGLPKVNVDRARMTEAVQNLLDNAAKFMGDQPDPRVEIGAIETSDGYRFFVRDNGMGIEPQYHERVFGLFNKLDAHTEGTGVGLSLVRRIIEVHGGRIWLESEGAGRGTTFWFTLAKGEGKV